MAFDTDSLRRSELSTATRRARQTRRSERCQLRVRTQPRQRRLPRDGIPTLGTLTGHLSGVADGRRHPQGRPTACAQHRMCRGGHASAANRQETAAPLPQEPRGPDLSEAAHTGSREISSSIRAPISRHARRGSGLAWCGRPQGSPSRSPRSTAARLVASGSQRTARSSFFNCSTKPLLDQAADAGTDDQASRRDRRWGNPALAGLRVRHHQNVSPGK